MSTAYTMSISLTLGVAQVGEHHGCFEHVCRAGGRGGAIAAPSGTLTPGWSLATIYRGMGQFMVIQILCLLLILFWPDVVLWLPRALRM